MNIKCEKCEKEFYCAPSRYYSSKHHCCSKACANLLSKEIRESDESYFNVLCDICGKAFHQKHYQVSQHKNHYCSKECLREGQRIHMTGEGNHQFGLTGEKNASWKGGRKLNSYGYVLLYYPEHPFANSDGNVFEHRLVAEQYLLTPENSVVVGGKRYLSKDYAVHHKDQDRTNNNPQNLEVILKGDHVSFHNRLKPRERDNLGRFI